MEPTETTNETTQEQGALTLEGVEQPEANTSEPISPNDEILDRIVGGDKKQTKERQKKEFGKFVEKQQKSKVVPRDLAAEALGQGTEPVESDQNPSDIFTKALELLEGKPEQEETQEQETEEDLKDLDPNGRAATNIRNLRARSQKAEEEAKEATQRAWEYHNAYQQMQTKTMQETAKLREQLAATNARFEMLMRQQQSQPEDPADRLQREWLDKMSQVTDERSKPLLTKISQLEQKLQTQERQAQLNAIKRRNSSEAEMAMRDLIFKNVDPEVAKQTAGDVKTWLYAIAANNNCSLQDAAKLFMRTQLKLSLGMIKAQGKVKSEGLKRSAATPAPIPKGRSGTGGEADPTHEQIKADGRFRDLPDWYMHGKPPLRTNKRG